MPRSHKDGADGVVSSAGLSKGRRTDHPVRDKSERIQFFDVADTPPLRGGECARRKTLSKKLKVAALLHKRDFFVPFVYLPAFLGKATVAILYENLTIGS